MKKTNTKRDTRKTVKFKDLYLIFIQENKLIIKDSTSERHDKIYSKYLSLIENDKVANLNPLDFQHRILTNLFILKKYNTLNFIVKYVNQILNFGVAINFIEKNPLVNLVYLPIVKNSLKKAAEVKKHHPTLDHKNLHSEIKKLIKTFQLKANLRQNLLLELSLRTLLRQSELVKIQIDDLDIKKHTLTLRNTKTKSVFVIPTTLSLEECIKKAYKQFGSENYKWIFVNVRFEKDHLSAQTLNKALKDKGYKNKLVAHGIRSIGANFFAKHSRKIPIWVAAACLQHSVSTQVERAYRRDDFFKDRIYAMKLWNKFLDSIYEDTTY